MEDAKRSNGIDMVLAVWSRRKWLAIMTFCAGLAAAVGVAIFLPNRYRAEAKLLIDRQQIPEAMVKSTVTSAIDTRVQTITQEILSRSRLENLITRLDLYADLRERLPLDQLIGRMRRDILVELKQAEHDSRDFARGTFTISFSGSDAQQVALVANTLASFYVEENLKARERQAIGTSHFVQAQLEAVKAKLDEQEQRVSAFKERYMGDLPQQQEANLATLKQLNEQLRTNSDTQTRASERRAMLEKQLAEVDGFRAAGGPDATAARLAQLNQELTELRTRFSEKYPDVIRMRTEIAALETRLNSAKQDKKSEKDKETAVPASPYVMQLRQAVGEVELEMKSLKAEAEGLRRSIANYQRRVEQAPRRELEFQMLARDYEATKEVYHSLLKRQGEAQMAESMEQGQKGEQFRILEPATVSYQPAKPNRARLILMGLLLSLGMATGVGLMAERLDTSFHTVDDLRAFARVPVLAGIPSIVTEGDLAQRRRRFYVGAAAAVVGLMLIVVSAYSIATGKMPLVGELAQGRLLRM